MPMPYRPKGRRSRSAAASKGWPLDKYLKFLAAVQKLFSPFSVSREKTTTRLNRL